MGLGQSATERGGKSGLLVLVNLLEKSRHLTSAFLVLFKKAAGDDVACISGFSFVACAFFSDSHLQLIKTYGRHDVIQHKVWRAVTPFQEIQEHIKSYITIHTDTHLGVCMCPFQWGWINCE